MNFEKVIEVMKTHNVKTLLDIGAWHGDFSTEIHNRYSECDCFCIEANPYCEPPLKESGFAYKIAVLSDVVKPIKLFLNTNRNDCTGTSYYREMNKDFFPQTHYLELETAVLDSVVEPNKFEFIKLDTQGSELDILNGGTDVLKSCKILLIEVSVIPYNHGSPTSDEVEQYMTKLGFVKESVVAVNTQGGIHQEDWLYVKKEIHNGKN